MNFQNLVPVSGDVLGEVVAVHPRSIEADDDHHYGPMTLLFVEAVQSPHQLVVLFAVHFIEKYSLHTLFRGDQRQRNLRFL